MKFIPNTVFKIVHNDLVVVLKSVKGDDLYFEYKIGRPLPFKYKANQVIGNLNFTSWIQLNNKI